jgi:hypothetical protein
MPISRWAPGRDTLDPRSRRAPNDDGRLLAHIAGLYDVATELRAGIS